MKNIFSNQNYIPILSISPAEMSAIEQLPDKDKDLLLPLFPLRGWVAAHHLKSALKRITDSVGNRTWIADIDEKFLTGNKNYLFTGELPKTPIYQELKALLSPNNNYENWCTFIQQNETAIPCIRHETLEGLEIQIQKLNELNRGIVLRIQPEINNLQKHENIVRTIQAKKSKNVIIIYDLETIDLNFKEHIPLLDRFMKAAKKEIPDVILSISASSFPAGFSGQQRGANSIYERMLFNSLAAQGTYNPLIYSDRGSARASKQDGGSGTPPPRIDYPLKKDWKFVRREMDDNAPNSKERRRSAYIEIATEIISSEYWAPELRLWGTQQIELTAEGNEFAIYSPQKSTAARINIHLFNQLHYNSKNNEINTDEEWTD